ncbi:acetoacetate--CoA ligase [Oceanospirillum linum]|uniref:Acetoacetate--CoA ligase n=1 Tax=Oceanospirillum linum TaxID=966 RepID=A0A1T1HCJ9_OCELI|nr:acetoacetate--CoA ligase [Oceanospirillum linum]OOV87542.1 acetoacetate--CoA ligase [Oceanospirillum linum]SEF91229.1 acetoacetyl-CoA synthetase [Oleiphilus messinensis]SMP13138.1 acetoacetyl-CoA synthetase [Oceanospirillum linum]
MSAPLWQPDSHRIESSNLHQFIRQVNDAHKLSLNDYSDLFEWSIDQTEAFWSELWDFAGVIADKKSEIVLENPDKMPGARWFPDSQLNFAENLLKYRDDRTAIVFRGEKGQRKALTYHELYQQVAQYAAGLKKMGVVKGDRVAGFVPNCAETLIAMLATTSIGAVWSSCSPDFGINGVYDRFGQIKPKVLFTTDGYFYAKKTLDSLEKVSGILERLPEIEQVVVIPFVDENPDLSALAEPAKSKATLLSDFADSSATTIDFEPVAFDHPLYIMYSSGTTGVPKCIVHSVGGTLIQHLKEHLLHTDVKRDDVLFYYTTCGWMMWNWLVSGLATGCTVLLYDGSPFHPRPNVLWNIAEEEGISIFGTSAKYIAALEKVGEKPRETHNLEKLKAVLSTGSPLAHESFDYVYRDIKADLCLSSISGGTDIVSCFALGCPTRPVYAGELQCRGLGMAVDIFDDSGKAIRRDKGELVCTKPFPSMPIGFWNDPKGEKYHDAYFASFDNVWAHGDYAEITEHDGLIIHGRSDAVLNPGGVRIGTAEIYRQVEKVDQVMESLCIGQDWEDDVRVVLFVRMKEGFSLNADIEKEIKSTIRANTTPRHVPAKIIEVSDIPRTISGKIVELAVRHVVHHRPVKNTDALANPEALELYKDLPQLQS